MEEQRKPLDLYQNGADFAQKVQAGLKEGKTFDEMYAFPPKQAARIRDIALEQGYMSAYIWYKGYVSRWD